MWYTSRVSDLVLSKDFFASVETIAEQIAGYLKKEDHLFVAKVRLYSVPAFDSFYSISET
jgi:hypothetical protein